MNAITVSVSQGGSALHLLPSGQGEMKARNMGVIDNHKCPEVSLKDHGVVQVRDRFKI